MSKAASGWDMDTKLVLPAETGTPPSGGKLFPGGSFVLRKDSKGRVIGDEFEGSGDGTDSINPDIWHVYDNENYDGGRGYKSALNIRVNNSVAGFRVTQDATGKILTAGIDSSPSVNNFGWKQRQGDLVVYALQRLDGTEFGLKQIVLNWPTGLEGDEHGWPPENDSGEFFWDNPLFITKTTHDDSLGKGVNHQKQTQVADTCDSDLPWGRWHRFAQMNLGRDCYYWTDHKDGNGFVLDAHHVVPAGAEIGNMRWMDIGHHNVKGQRQLAKDLYRLRVDFACLMVRA